MKQSQVKSLRDINDSNNFDSMNSSFKNNRIIKAYDD